MQYKKQDINDKILEAGKKEYLENGFRAGNISKIAENAGVPVGNLYRYFDGKTGLLDAIVRPCYNEVPKEITQLASFDIVDHMTLEQIMPELTEKLLIIFDKFGDEILILVDKSSGTRYDDFGTNIISQVGGLISYKLYASTPTEAEKTIADIISKAFVNSLFDLLRRGLNREEKMDVVKKLITFYFFEVDKRK